MIQLFKKVTATAARHLGREVSFLFMLAVLFAGCRPMATEGRLTDQFKIDSKYISERTYQVWLPPSYEASSASYPVLYLHDGQMLFDSTTTWNGQEWGVDEVMDKLLRAHKVQEAIVVGVWNGGSARHSEYFPQKPFESLKKATQDSIYQLGRSENQALFSGLVRSDDYLKFMVEELKRHIDTTYRTKKGPASTFTGGSSMGGLISLYALCEFPQVFGGAICMSTHWPGIFSIDNNPIPEAFNKYLTEYLPDPGTHKLYFDHGTETLDSLYEPFQKKVDAICIQRGFSSPNYFSRKYEGDSHDEKSWSKRLPIPLTFILNKKPL